MAAKPFSILFITSTRIGDAVLSTGLIARLMQEIPHARFTVAAGALSAPLFRDLPALEALIPIEKKGGGLHWLELWKRTRGTKWGLIVDLRGSGLAATLSAKVRIVRRSSDAGAPVMHKVEELARLLKVEGEPPAPRLWISEETQAEADDFLESRSEERGPILAVAPAANWIGKTWPAERFAVLIARLLAPGGPLADGRLLLLGGPEDRRATESIRREVPRHRVIDAAGEADLLVAAAMLRRARLFVGNDSGTMHLAAAAGAPTLGLFGPSDDRVYGPWGAHARAIRSPRSFESYKLLDPELNQSLSHMSDLSVERVLKAAVELLEETCSPVQTFGGGATPSGGTEGAGDHAETQLHEAEGSLGQPAASADSAPALQGSIEDDEPESAVG